MPNMICYNCGKEFTYTQGETSPVCSFCSAVNYVTRDQAGSRMRRLLDASLSSWEQFDRENQQLDAALQENPKDFGLLWNRFLGDLKIKYIEDNKPIFYRRIEQPVPQTAFFEPLWQNAPEKDRPALQQEIEKLEAHRQAIEQEFAWATSGFILMVDRGGEETAALRDKLSAQFQSAGLSYTVLSGSPDADPQNFVALGNARFLLLLCANQEQLRNDSVKSMYERFLLLGNRELSTSAICVCTPSDPGMTLPPALTGAVLLAGNRLDFNNRLWKQINSVLGTGYSAPSEDFAFGSTAAGTAAGAPEAKAASMQELLSRAGTPEEKPKRILAFEEDDPEKQERGSHALPIRKNRPSAEAKAQPQPAKPAAAPAPRKDGNKPARPAVQKTDAEPAKGKKTAFIAGICAGVIALGAGGVLAAEPAKRAIQYNKAQDLVQQERYSEAADAFAELGNYKDASALVSESQEKAAELQQKRAAYETAENMMNAGDYEGALAAFEALGDYSDAAMKAGAARDALEEKQRLEEEERLARIEQQNSEAYDAAMNLLSSGDYEGAIVAFEALGDYGDAAAQANAARNALTQKQQEEAELARVEQQNSEAYSAAAELMNSGNYEAAAAAFDALGDYSDAADMAANARQKQQEEAELARIEQQNRDAYNAAAELMNSGDYEGAIAAFDALGDYGDATAQADAARDALAAKQQADAEAAELARIEQQNRDAYNSAVALLNNGDYEAAIAAFEALGDYSDAADMAANARVEMENRNAYDSAVALLDSGDYEAAIIAFEALGDYGDAADMAAIARIEQENKINKENYDTAVSLLNSGDYDGAIAAFEALGEYGDAAAQADTARAEKGRKDAYSTAAALLESGDYEAAITAFEALGDYSDAATQADNARNLLAIAAMPYAGVYAPGNVISLGAFVQDGTEETPLEWIVLQSDENEALLICRFAPAVMPWSADGQAADWEESDVRAWLTGTFLPAAFTEGEAAALIKDEAGDAVTLLTAAEAKQFFTDNESRVCEVTAAAQMQRGSARFGGSACGWWLKNTASVKGKVATVATGGALPTAGSEAAEQGIAVRPVIRVNLHTLTGE